MPLIDFDIIIVLILKHIKGALNKSDSLILIYI